MTDLAERALRAAKIVAQPQLYKVCEGCESIVTHGAATCPNCHSYRFDTSSERIVNQARVLGSRPQRSVRPEDLID
jgi:hypothetical protein